MEKPCVCVVGAGVVGLSTAVRIQNELPSYDVTVLADRFSPDTTSDGSGGFWLPHLVGGDNQDMVTQWGRDTLDYLLYLATSPLASQVGAQMVSGYSFFSEPQSPEWRHQVLGYREVDRQEIKMIFPKARFGMFYTTVMIHVEAYLSWLMSRFKHSNGNVVRERIDKLEDLMKEYDVIVNCTGLGARKLVNDNDVTPIRGQVTRMKAPWVKHFMTYQGTNEHCEKYILPGADSVVLGGTGQKGNWNTDIDDEDRKMILEGCVEMVPSLKLLELRTHPKLVTLTTWLTAGVTGQQRMLIPPWHLILPSLLSEEAEVVRHWSGLRPHRTSGVRLETERLPNGKLVVHNYGHGGSGVTLHWGCAGHVVKEIRAAFTSNLSKL